MAVMGLEERLKALEERLESKLAEMRDIMLDFAKIAYKQEKDIEILRAQLSKSDDSNERLH